MRVEPIRDNDVVRRIAVMLSQDMSEAGRRRYLMYMTGIFLGRRISDMLRMKVGDVRGKDSFEIREKKTGKIIELEIPKNLRAVYRERLAGMDEDDWLLQSGAADRITGGRKPIHRNTALRDMKAIQQAAHLNNVNIGTHTMRKTFGYRFYQTTHDVAMLMKLFNHSKEETTLIYIGIAQDEMRESIRIVNNMYDT